MANVRQTSECFLVSFYYLCGCVASHGLGGPGDTLDLIPIGQVRDAFQPVKHKDGVCYAGQMSEEMDH